MSGPAPRIAPARARWLLGLLWLGACAEVAPPDAGLVSRDAAELDAGVRSVEERGLFGDQPMDERVLDPSFELLRLEWQVLRFGREGDVIEARHWLRRGAPSPTRAPVLYVPPRSGGSPVAIYGRARGDLPGLVASVWVGRQLGEGSPRVYPGLMVTNLHGVDEDLELAPDPATPAQIVEDIRWERYHAPLPLAVHGWMSLRVVDYSVTGLYVASPSVRGASALRGVVPASAAPTPELRRWNAEVDRRRQALLDGLARERARARVARRVW